MDSAAIEKMERLLSRKSFEDLDSGEREFVLEQLGSGDEYSAMYALNQHLKANVPPTSDPRILTSLQRRMRDREQKTFSLQWVLQAKVPAPVFYVVVLGLVIALLIERPVDPPRSITYIERDTIVVSALPDTVFIERVVYKPTPTVAKPTDVVVSSTQGKKENAAEGVSMRERQELEILLESGS
jgi:hypothetical protein